MNKDKAFGIFIFVCGLFVFFVMIANSGSSTKYTSYSSNRKSTSCYSSSAKTCVDSGCTRSRMSGSSYCSFHTCIKSGCNSHVVSGSSYCYSHQPSTTGGGTSTHSYSNTSGNTKKYDPYDVYDYDNGDDFAEEWAEEFGDGDYEDGYDDAYDYWEDEME